MHDGVSPLPSHHLSGRNEEEDEEVKEEGGAGTRNRITGLMVCALRRDKQKQKRNEKLLKIEKFSSLAFKSDRNDARFFPSQPPRTTTRL